MAKSTKDLKQEWQDAEAEAHKLQNEKDQAIDRVRSKYTSRQQKANQKAADAQKRWCDAEAADALRDRPDGEAVAEALGLKL